MLKKLKLKALFNKTSSIILSVVIVLSTLTVGLYNLAAEGADVWDGTAALSFAGGTGTKDDPFLIENGGQLYKMVADYSNTASSSAPKSHTYFKITADIDLGGKQWYKTGVTSYPSGTNYTTGFSGIILGEGHTIKNLYSKVSSATVGLIPVATQGAEIYNLHIEGANLPKAAWNTYAVGGFIGLAKGAGSSAPIVISGCSVKDLTAQSRDATSAFVGMTYSQSIKFENCYVKDVDLSHTSTATTSVNSGAFLGITAGNDYGNSIVIKNSHCADQIPTIYANNAFKAIISYQNVYTSNSVYDGTVAGLTKLTADQMKGETAKTNMSGLDFESVWQTVDDDYPIINIRAAINPPSNPIWDGTKDENLEGEGTQASPYLIKTPEQLAFVVSTNLTDGLYFKLANDIKIHDTTKANWKTNARNWVWANVRFVGTFDGDGHTIDGLYFDGSQKRMGLFAYAGDSLIKNVKFSNAYINDTTSDEGVAIVVGQTSATTTFDCIYVDETCYLNAPNATGVAAITGRGYENGNNADAIISNSAVLATINGNGSVGAFAGAYWAADADVIINNCFTSSNVSLFGYPYKGLTDSANNYGTVADSFGTTILSVDQMKGEAAKDNMSGLDFDKVFKTVDGRFPVIEVREGTPIVPPPPVPDYVWDGTAADSFAGGDGSEKSPFLIETPQQLYKMVVEYSTKTASDGKFFKITADLYLNDVKDGTAVTELTDKKNWLSGYSNGTIATPSKENSFYGTLDGDGHTIYGLYAAGSGKLLGLFPAITNGTVIKNLSFDNLFIEGSNGIGAAIAGRGIYSDWHKTAQITNCSVTNGVIGRSNNLEMAAGFVADATSIKLNIADCYSYNLDTSAWGATAGLVANDWDSATIVINMSYTAGNYPVSANINKATCTMVYTNVSAPVGSETTTITVLADDQMKGEAAKVSMVGFDFDRSWKTVENGYPIRFKFERPDYIWDGTTAENFAGGTGTPADPFLIENGAQLFKMVKEYSNASGAADSINKQYYFKLTNDIHLNDVNAKDLANPTVESWNSIFNQWYKVTSYSKGFCGDLDGAGYTVYGLYSNTGYSGLIPVLLDGGRIHNLNLKNSFIYGTESAGSLVGFVKGHWKMAPVSISYCTVDNVVATSTKKYVGGIVGGYADTKITLSDCSVTRAKLTSKNENPHLVSGFIGTGWGNIVHPVSNCFTDSTVHPVGATADKANFDIITAAATYTNVYTSAIKNFEVKGITYLNNDNLLKGDSAKKTLKGFDFNYDWTAVSGDFPAIKKGAGLWKYDNLKAGEVWSGKLAASYASGDGTKEKPYEIKTGGQLALLANDALSGKTTGRYYRITADIILNDTTKEGWESRAHEWYTGSWAKAFRGHLDGGYHIISGLYLNKTKENYKGTDYYGGLFAAIGQGAVIEKLGIVNSSLTFTHDTESKYVGAFAGFVDQYNAAEAGYENYPLIRECFADTSVYISGGSAGGFIGCATRPIRVENSFFTGTVAGTGRGLFGYSKMNVNYDEILVKNFYAADSSSAVISNASYDNFNYQNCYSSSAQETVGIVRLFIDRMCGDNAKQYMTGFDFDNIWVVGAKNETPALRGFKKNHYNNVMNPKDITISFETNCDLIVDSITGKAYSKLTLPTLKREGYIFEGWYAYPELDTPFNYDYFPTFNTILYAKWSLSGYYQDFENYTDSVYDYHEGIEYYRPTVSGYSAKYVRGGAKSIHRLGGIDDYLDFLLFYKEELEVGKTYKMVFYTTTDQDKASVKLSLVHLDWPDVYSANTGVQEIGTLESIVNGKWVEHTFTFVAKSKWIAIRSEGMDSVFFDDFTLYNTSGKADEIITDLDGLQNNILLIVIVAIASLFVIGGAVAAVIIIKNCKKGN